VGRTLLFDAFDLGFQKLMRTRHNHEAGRLGN
jgi:hypothetical protein